MHCWAASEILHHEILHHPGHSAASDSRPEAVIPPGGTERYSANDPRQGILSKPGICAGLLGTEIKQTV